MGTTPTHSTILAGIVTALGAIEKDAANSKGYIYNYTPEKVMRVPTFEGFRDLLRAPGDGPYYFVRDDAEESSLGAVRFGFEGWETEVPVLVSIRDTRAEKSALRGADSPGEIQDLMVGDVVACLTADERRGVSKILQTTVSRVDRDTHDVLQGWILAWIEFTVEYETAIGVP